MVEVGIPVYKAQDTIRNALNSLVSQTRKMFITCLSIDSEEEDYSDIIKEYQQRGLNIRVISGPNGGPGIARQRIIDTTDSDYIMFLDADDMLMPQAVDSLYRSAKASNFDIMRSSFIREEANKQDIYLPHDMNTVTWFHGKIYKVSFLKEKNIQFHPNLRTEEDAYFNLIAWNCAERKGELDQVTYYWRYNKNSLTRLGGTKWYFATSYNNYIYSQVEALKSLFTLKPDISDILITYTLVNIYNHYMTARFYKLNESEMDKNIHSLRYYIKIQEYFQKGQNWIDLLNQLKPGKLISDDNEQFVVFFKETFEAWATRLLF